jgi:2,3-bisphosphoglycerate-dependent phosphoglycerate mutase
MYIKVNRRAILPHEILGTPVTKYSLTYGANWIRGLNGSIYSIQEYTELAERGVGSAANLSMQQITDIVQQDPRYANLPKGWKSDSHFCLPFQGAESLLDAGRRVANLLTVEMQALYQQSQRNQIKIFVGHGAAFRHAAYHLGLLQYEQIAQLSMFHCQPIFIEGYESIFGLYR